MLTLVVKLADYGLNRNKRIYPKELWKKGIESDYIQEQLKLKRLFGEMNHPEGAEANRASIDMNNITHNIVDFDLRDDGLYGTLDILDTPSGRIAKTLLDYGSKLGISSRGAGSLDSNGEVIPDTYKIFSWDLVNYQSSKDCVLQESVIQEVTEQEVEDILKQYRSLYESTNPSTLNEKADLTPSQEIVQQLIRESAELNA